jgi:hypothetical protein
MRDIAKLTSEAVRQEGGVVQSFTGDGVMAAFGAPVAYEDAPLRACRSALSVLHRLDNASSEFEKKFGVRPQLRIGLNTGLAVVGEVQEGASGGVTVMGDAVNVAARLQSLAEPGTIYLSEATHRLARGRIDATPQGEHQLKGKAESLKVYKLTGLRRNSTRFAAAIERGLSLYVGRERELAILEHHLEASRQELRLVDIVAEPGMGKSRLLHEFQQRVGADQAFVLPGNCSLDGQQTPFLPFIEVVRGSFRVSAGEAVGDVAQKLEMGLTTLGLHSSRNLGLMLHLLGLKVPDGALAGLDGVLIGLRTRDLLLELLEARCLLSPVVLVIEDLHWIDGASQEVLGKIVRNESKLRLLLLTTRRPEFTPPWLDYLAVANLPLEPLPTGDIHSLVRHRLSVDALPEMLAKCITNKAEGNPLFAEEVVSFLTERGMVRTIENKLDFAASAIDAVLPASIQSLLTARIDRLPAGDRALLQAAAVIGRRFDPQLLAVIGGEENIDSRLHAMQALDLIYHEEKSNDYLFKHALVQDVLYQSLLSEQRKNLHWRIAEEIERLSRNRLTEMAEVLAYHYGQTDHEKKAFAYLAMVGLKSFNLYSFDEAANHFTAATDILDRNADCATDEQVGDLLVDYTKYLVFSLRFRLAIELVERLMPRLDRSGDCLHYVIILHQYILSLLYSGDYTGAQKKQLSLAAMADRLHDYRAKAYALVTAMHVSTHVEPYPVEVFDTLTREITERTTGIDDAYLQYFARAVVVWDEILRGRMASASQAADEVMAAGQRLNDPRATGFALQLHAWTALLSDDYVTALSLAEAATNAAITPYDFEGARNVKIAALVLLRRPEAFQIAQDFRNKCEANGWNWHLTGVDGMLGISMVLRGDIGNGISWIEKTICRIEEQGWRAAADWLRLFLCEIYIEIIAGREKPPAKILARNALTLLDITFTAQKRISTLIAHIRLNPHFDASGHHIGRSELILGLLYKTKKRHALAVQHLIEAKRILSQYGRTPILVRAETALAELGQ